MFESKWRFMCCSSIGISISFFRAQLISHLVHHSPPLTVEAHLISLSQNRTVKSSTGATIGTIRKPYIPKFTLTGYKPAWYLGSLDDERKTRVQMKGLLNPTTCNAEIYLGDTAIGEVVGNWSARSYT